MFGQSRASTRHRKVDVRKRLRMRLASELPELLDNIEDTFDKVETGVEKDEEQERHLQQVLRSQQAQEKKSAAIPIPDASRLFTDYALLPYDRFIQPQSLIQFSNTVEEMNKGASYSLDEHDYLWLGKFSVTSPTGEKLAFNQDPALLDAFEEGISWVEALSRRMHYRKQLPSLDKFREEVSRTDIQPNWPTALNSIDGFNDALYAYWESRCLIGGRLVHMLPELKTVSDGNENDLYVCFRHRDPPAIRRTRRTVRKCVESIKSLQDSLQRAAHLVEAVEEREKLRKGILDELRKMFDKKCELRAYRAEIGLVDESVDGLFLLVKKPKKDSLLGDSKLKLSFKMRDKKGRAIGDDDKYGNSAERLQAQIEAEMQRRKQADMDWEDVTELPYFPFGTRNQRNKFRPITQPFPVEAELQQPATYCRQFHYRRRVGRGGRIFLDRRAVSDINKNPHALYGYPDRTCPDKYKYDQDYNGGWDNDADFYQASVPAMDDAQKAKLAFLPLSPVVSPQVFKRRLGYWQGEDTQRLNRQSFMEETSLSTLFRPYRSHSTDAMMSSSATLVASQTLPEGGDAILLQQSFKATNGKRTLAPPVLQMNNTNGMRKRKREVGLPTPPHTYFKKSDSPDPMNASNVLLMHPNELPNSPESSATMAR